MEWEDRITIATPEGIELQLVLAGVGSRFIASVTDLALQLLLIGLSALAAFGLLGDGLALAVFAMAVFAALYLYDVLFEVLAAGRTPGKRMTHLRVVRDDGGPVDLPASATRNVLRLIDILPGAYLVGLAAMMLSRNNQRLGDLAAGTLVIRESEPHRGASPRGDPSPPGESSPRDQSAPPSAPAGELDSQEWDVSAVSTEEMAAVRRFLERRESLDARARHELAYRLEQGLRAKAAGAPRAADPERFLEALARTKARR